MNLRIFTKTQEQEARTFVNTVTVTALYWSFNKLEVWYL